MDQALRIVLNVFKIKFLAFSGTAFELIYDILDQDHIDKQGKF